MITITKLKMWEDPGYTKGCVEIPPAGSWKLPAADYTSSENLRPRKNMLMGAVELPLSYIQVMNMSYLYMEAQDDGNRTFSMFGWIDTIEQSASSADAVIIRWTPDYWRTYSGSAVFKRGMIRKCKQSGYKRPYQTEPRKWKVTHAADLFQKTGTDATYPYNVVVAYNHTENNVTSIKYAFWRCSLTAGKDTVSGKTNPSLQDVYNGRIDELLGIDPAAITGIFVVPFLGWAGSTSVIVEGASHFAYLKQNFGSQTFSWALDQIYETDDMKRAVIMDPTGAIVATFPWGYSADYLAGYADVGTVSASTHLYLVKQSAPMSVPAYCAEGMCVDIPGLPCPVNSNAYSSYVYSGRREYEIDMRQIQTNQKGIAGGVGAGANLLGAGLMAMIPGAQILAGFSASGAGTQGVGAASNYLLETFVFNDQLQYAEDRMYSNQSANILIGGGGEGWAYSNALKDWKILQLEADTTSKDEYNNMVALNGYDVDSQTSDVSTFITGGGPLLITDLVVRGNIPPEAKASIKAKLEKGVYIIEKNPTGVVP